MEHALRLLAAARAPRFPVGDPQFWIVTAVALGALLWLAWKLAPRALLGRRRRAGQKRATLTVGGRPVDGAPRRDCH